MLLNPQSKTTRQPVCQSLLFLIGVVGLIAASIHQDANGQPVQPRIVQQPFQGPIYQSPTYRGPIYQSPNYSNQGFPNQGRIIQPQPLPASPIYRAPQPQVGQPVPPVAQRVQQPRRPNAQQIAAAQEAAYNAEKLAIVEKLLETYKVSAAETEVALRQLDSIKQQNVELNARLSEFNETTQNYQTRIRDLEARLASAGKANPTAVRATEQLKANYEQVVLQAEGLQQRAESLQTEVQRLSEKNRNYSGQIANLKAAQERASNLRPAESNQLSESTELAETNQQLTVAKQALQQENQKLYQEKNALNVQYRDLNQQHEQVMLDNQQLNDRIAKLSFVDNNNAEEVSKVTAMTPAATETDPSVDVSYYETKISRLTRENRQLTESNSDFKNKNKSLSRRLASPKTQTGVTVDETASSAALASVPASLSAVSSSAIDEGEKGWGVLGWLIPFLAIGLGIAFFVIIKEELHRPPVGATSRPKL